MILYDAWSSDKVALLLLNASLVECQSGEKNRFYIEKNPIFSYSYDALAMRWGAFLCVEPGNMIFYLQGPIGMNPLQAGVALVPFGIGVMVAGFASGALSDKLGIRMMAMIGPIVTVAAVCALASFDGKTSPSVIGGVLFLSGFGIGVFGSPNSTAMMLSVKPEDRGVASAISIITLMFTGMLGIVLTFAFVLNSMSQQQLFAIFINGGSTLSDAAIDSCLTALRQDYYIVIACCLAACVGSYFNNFDVKENSAMHAKAAAALT